MTDYLSKPINPRELFALIAKYGGERPADTPPVTHFMERVGRPRADPDDGADDLAELMGELDVLIEEA